MPRPSLLLTILECRLGKECNMKTGIFCDAIIPVHLQFTNEIIYLVFENEL